MTFLVNKANIFTQIPSFSHAMGEKTPVILEMETDDTHQLLVYFLTFKIHKRWIYFLVSVGTFTNITTFLGRFEKHKKIPTSMYTIWINWYLKGINDCAKIERRWVFLVNLTRCFFSLIFFFLAGGRGEDTGNWRREYKSIVL